MSAASKLFDAFFALGNEEEKLSDFLEGLSIEWEWEEETFDYYDASVEFKQCTNGAELSTAQLQKLWEYGFKRCWVNRIDGSERYYRKPKGEGP